MAATCTPNTNNSATNILLTGTVKMKRAGSVNGCGSSPGAGGVFYDYLRPEDDTDAERLIEFQRANGDAFLKAYVPIVEKRKDIPYDDAEIRWQELRRGRYVEFNLVHDRGTLFGLKTNGRIESILMSMPPRARWEYNYQPPTGSREADLLEHLKPREWA